MPGRPWEDSLSNEAIDRMNRCNGYLSNGKKTIVPTGTSSAKCLNSVAANVFATSLGVGKRGKDHRFKCGSAMLGALTECRTRAQSAALWTVYVDRTRTESKVVTLTFQAIVVKIFATWCQCATIATTMMTSMLIADTHTCFQVPWQWVSESRKMQTGRCVDLGKLSRSHPLWWGTKCGNIIKIAHSRARWLRSYTSIRTCLDWCICQPARLTHVGLHGGCKAPLAESNKVPFLDAHVSFGLFFAGVHVIEGGECWKAPPARPLHLRFCLILQQCAVSQHSKYFRLVATLISHHLLQHETIESAPEWDQAYDILEQEHMKASDKTI